MRRFQQPPSDSAAGPGKCSACRRNRCSACSGIGVRLAVESVFGLERNQCSAWSGIRSHAREQWGKFTDDELEEVGGKKDRLVGKLQQKYGYAADEAAWRADEWAKQQDAKPQDEATKT